jgi:hypothetical protein
MRIVLCASVVREREKSELFVLYMHEEEIVLNQVPQMDLVRTNSTNPLHFKYLEK